MNKTDSYVLCHFVIRAANLAHNSARTPYACVRPNSRRRSRRPVSGRGITENVRGATRGDIDSRALDSPILLDPATIGSAPGGVSTDDSRHYATDPQGIGTQSPILPERAFVCSHAQAFSKLSSRPLQRNRFLRKRAATQATEHPMQPPSTVAWECPENRFSLRSPTLLDRPARRARFTAIVRDQGKFARELSSHLHVLPQARPRPFLDCGVKTAAEHK